MKDREQFRKVLSIDFREGIAKLETIRGEVVEIAVRDEEESQDPRKGVVESFYPLLERVFANHKEILSPDQNYWLTLVEEAPFTYETAAIYARVDGFSSRMIARRVIDGMAALSGTQLNINKDLRRQLIDETAEEIIQIYISTTEVRPQVRK